MNYLLIMRIHFSTASATLLFTTLLLALTDCSSKKSEQADGHTSTPDETAATTYETAENKVALDDLYQLEHLKEWYPKRIMPPAFDYSMDISTKSPIELWLLRNEIFARNGYLFDDAVLRGYFNQFPWYQPIFDVPGFRVKLNKQEQDFVNKLIARENELKAQRYVTLDGYQMIHTDHVYNALQFKTIPPALLGQLARTNFAIVPAKHEQLFHVYDENHYQYIPTYISTDIYLQVLHKHFSSILRRVEEENFIPLLSALLKRMYDESIKAEQTTDPRLQQTAQWTSAYLGIAYSLLTSKQVPVAGNMTNLYKKELQSIRGATGMGSSFLQSDWIVYSQFAPRGNYRKSPALENYFRCMKWLNTAPLFIDTDEGLLRVVYLASFISRSSATREPFQQFDQAIRFIVGDEDNRSLTHVISALSATTTSDPAALADPTKLSALREQLMAIHADRIRPSGTSEAAKEITRPMVLFTAGRYTFDAEILSKLVHTLQPHPLRAFPKGLDVWAAFGSKEAENILLHEYNEGEKWRNYPDELNNVKKQFGSYTDWDKNIYSKTMEMINSVRTADARQPLFMKTPSWERKNLITSLAAWTELKHDMLLYSEQPYAAQAGEGGGPPPPQHIGYVEPNSAFWKKALELIDLQEKTLERQKLLGEDIKILNDELRELGNFLLMVSEKELNGEPLTPEEFDNISWIGGEIEQLTFRIFDTDHLPEKERLVALVADVYQNNGSYLEEAVGLADEIYVVAEINGKPYLTRGSVFSYYEFTNAQPLNDEQWQKQLLDNKAPPRPDWTKRIMVNVPSLESKEAYSLLGANRY